MDEKNLSKIQQPLPALSDTQIYEAIRAALADARTKVFAAVNSAMVGVYWEIGRQISDAVGDRAEYGLSHLCHIIIAVVLSIEQVLFEKGFIAARFKIGGIFICRLRDMQTIF